MKSVLISIQPKWCELIASGKKTVEVRKTRPKLETPFKCYIYCTQQRVNGEILLTHDKKVEGRNRGFRDDGDIPLAGKVIGEFVCDEIYDCRDVNMDDTCITVEEWLHYTRGHKGVVYGWHISNLVIYNEPRELHHFFKPCGECDKKDTKRCTEEISYCRAKVITRPPQSWCYVEERSEGK